MDMLLHMDNWVIVCSQSLNHYVNCMCGHSVKRGSGHRVKRITYLYNKQSKAIQYIGKTCVRTYGVEFSLTNPILLDVIKDNLHRVEWDRNMCIREHIQSQYTTFMTMVKDGDISVVGPFHRLLSDVCELVSEYGYDLVDVLRDIEREVESLDHTARHQMVDEYSLCDTISEIASEHSLVLSDVEDNPEEQEQEQEQEQDEKVTVRELVEDIIVELVSNNYLDEIPEELGHCCSRVHCSCEMKYRMRCLNQSIENLRTNIKITREEIKELIDKTVALRINAREYLDKSIENSSKYSEV